MEREKLWTKKEKKELNDIYFKILRITREYYEIQSRNTGHLWIIKKQYTNGYFVTLYHKHSQKILYYHKQCNLSTVGQGIKIIKKHDRYIQNRGLGQQ